MDRPAAIFGLSGASGHFVATRKQGWREVEFYPIGVPYHAGILVAPAGETDGSSSRHIRTFGGVRSLCRDAQTRVARGGILSDRSAVPRRNFSRASRRNRWIVQPPYSDFRGRPVTLSRRANKGGARWNFIRSECRTTQEF